MISLLLSYKSLILLISNLNHHFCIFMTGKQRDKWISNSVNKF